MTGFKNIFCTKMPIKFIDQAG